MQYSIIAPFISRPSRQLEMLLRAWFVSNGSAIELAGTKLVDLFGVGGHRVLVWQSCHLVSRVEQEGHLFRGDLWDTDSCS